jgi:hypothetical protein
MSATFNVQRFSEYFSFPVLGKLAPAPIIDLDKYRDQKTSFMINTYYLCQLGLLGPVSSLYMCEPELRPVICYSQRQFGVTEEAY